MWDRYRKRPRATHYDVPVLCGIDTGNTQSVPLGSRPLLGDNQDNTLQQEEGEVQEQSSLTTMPFDLAKLGNTARGRHMEAAAQAALLLVQPRKGPPQTVGSKCAY